MGHLDPALNGHLAVGEFNKQNRSYRPPFLVMTRLVNLVYAARNERFTTDGGELAAALIAGTPVDHDFLTTAIMKYRKLKVGDFLPEVNDMEVESDNRDQPLCFYDLRSASLVLPSLIGDRRELLVDEISDSKVSNGEWTSCLVATTPVNGPALRSIVESYRSLIVATYNPAS